MAIGVVAAVRTAAVSTMSLKVSSKPEWLSLPGRYGVAIAAVLLATLISLLVRPLTHASASPLFVGAVILSAWLGGMAPGLLATVLALVGLDFVMSPTHHSFAVNEDVLARLSVFLLVALFISALDTVRRRAEAERPTVLERERIARAEADAANQAKDEFVTMVAHELRTPLTAVSSWTAALRAGKLAADQRMEIKD